MMEQQKRDYRVYVAGPMFSSGRVTANVHEALKIATRLRAAGFQVFVPHLYAFWDVISPQELAFWLEMDKHWLEACDVLLRIPGVSAGGSLEEGWATDKQIPVFHYNVSAISCLIAACDAGDIPLRGVL